MDKTRPNPWGAWITQPLRSDAVCLALCLLVLAIASLPLDLSISSPLADCRLSISNAHLHHAHWRDTRHRHRQLPFSDLSSECDPESGRRDVAGRVDCSFADHLDLVRQLRVSRGTRTIPPHFGLSTPALRGLSDLQRFFLYKWDYFRRVSSKGVHAHGWRTERRWPAVCPSAQAS